MTTRQTHPDGTLMQMATRILVSAPGVKLGGAKRHLAPFLAALTQARPYWQVHLVVAGQSDISSNGNLTTHSLTSKGVASRLWMDIGGLRQTAVRVRASCIVNLTNSGPLWPRVPSILYQRNSIYFDPTWVPHMNHRERFDASLRRALAYREMAASVAVVTPTEAMQQFLRAWPSARSHPKPVVIPHAVDTAAFPFVPRKDVQVGSIRVLSVGHPAPHKGFEVGIRTIHELRSRGIDACLTLTVARDGKRSRTTGYGAAIQDYVDSLLAETASFGLEDSIHFDGPTEDVRALYASHDALLFPSHTESFGFPLLEAMASGLPVVASDIPATREVLAGNGRLFDDGDHRGAADALTEATTLPNHTLLNKARRHAQAHSWSANAERLAALVDEVTSSHPPVSR